MTLDPRPLVLVVEDNEDERRIYTALLEHFGCEVIEAADSVEAIPLARQHLPDLILMDIMLPTMSGLTATEVLRLGEETKQIPVVAMSHFDVPPDAPQIAGCDRFLPKPIAPQRLQELLEEILRPGAGTDPERGPPEAS